MNSKKNLVNVLIIFVVVLVNTSMYSQNPNNTYLNIKSFGAKGDGKTDDTPALLKAMEAATQTEGTVYFPHGNYLIHPVKVPSHITLLGYSARAYANKDKADKDYIGKTILTANSGNGRA